MSTRSEKLPHTVGFRLSDEAWKRLEAEATEKGETPGDWCREVVLERLFKERGFTKNERIIFEELSRLRYLAGHGFRLLANGKLTSQEWEKVRATSDEKPAEIAAVLLAGHRAANGSGG
jgi:hypothetical protein